MALVCFAAGLVGGCVATLQALKTKPRSLVIHIRSAYPGIYKDRLCEECRRWNYKTFAEYLDQDMRAWCGEHLPKKTKYAERAVREGDGHAQGVCMAHGMECPKPWSIV
jgi:hypothetical protein